MSDNERMYRKGHDEYVSVSTVKGLLMNWGVLYFYGKHGTTKAKALAKEATDIGTRIHDIAHKWFEKGERKFKVKEKEKWAYNNFKVWADLISKKFKPVLLEHTVYSEKYKFAGTFDGLFEGKEYYLLDDYKTSGRIYDDMEIQLEPYYRALLENKEQYPQIDWDKPFRLGVSRFDKEAEGDYQMCYGLKPETDFWTFDPCEDRYENGFLPLLHYYWWREKRKKERRK